jgi:hypothetical protein
MRIGRGTEVVGENLPQCHFAHHKSHMTWSGPEPRPPKWEASDQPPELRHGQTFGYKGTFCKGHLWKKMELRFGDMNYYLSCIINTFPTQQQNITIITVFPATVLYQNFGYKSNLRSRTVDLGLNICKTNVINNKIAPFKK